MNSLDKMKAIMHLINDTMIQHFKNIGEEEDPNLIMNVLLNMIAQYCSIMGTDPAYVFQQGIDNFGKASENTTTIGGIGLEFE